MSDEPRSLDESDDGGDDREPLLGGGDQRSADGTVDQRSADAAGDDPSRPRDDPADAPDSDVPLAGLREDVEERRHRPSPAVEDVFEAVEVDEVVDGDRVWDALLDGEDADAGLLAFAEQVADERDHARIIPDRICHGCPHFGDPPELHCTHEGTTIRRMVDMDHFEVVECPVVQDRGELRED